MFCSAVISQRLVCVLSLSHVVSKGTAGRPLRVLSKVRSQQQIPGKQAPWAVSSLQIFASDTLKDE